MLSSDEIEKRLGVSTIRQIESAVAAAFVAAERSADLNGGIEAVRQLLLSMLAATIVTQIDGAHQLANQIGGELVELVEHVLLEQRTHTTEQ